MPQEITITFKSPLELESLEKIKALTFTKSSKKAILRMIESYDEIMRECSDLRSAKSQVSE